MNSLVGLLGLARFSKWRSGRTARTGCGICGGGFGGGRFRLRQWEPVGAGCLRVTAAHSENTQKGKSDTSKSGHVFHNVSSLHPRSSGQVLLLPEGPGLIDLYRILNVAATLPLLHWSAEAASAPGEPAPQTYPQMPPQVSRSLSCPALT